LTLSPLFSDLNKQRLEMTNGKLFLSHCTQTHQQKTHNRINLKVKALFKMKLTH
jgi:hypothetical protein